MTRYECGGVGPHDRATLTNVCPRSGCSTSVTRCLACGGFQEVTRLMEAHILGHDVATGRDQCTGCAGNGSVCLADCLGNLADATDGPYPGR